MRFANRIKTYLVLFCLILAFAGSSCVETTETEAKKEFEALGMGAKKVLLYALKCLQLDYTVKDDDGFPVVGEDGTYKTDFTAISMEYKLQSLRDMEEAILRFFKDERELRKYINVWRRLRSYPEIMKRLERKALIYSESIERIERIGSFLEFCEHLGLQKAEDYVLLEKWSQYTSFLLYPGRDFASKDEDGNSIGKTIEDRTHFVPPYVNIGEDKEVSWKIVEDVFRVLDSNPAYPANPIAPQKIWIDKQYKLFVGAYDTDNDEKEQPEYILVYRYYNGEKESFPLIAVYAENSGSEPVKVVIELDRPEMQGIPMPSYGVPDKYDTIYKGNESAHDFYVEHHELIAEALTGRIPEEIGFEYEEKPMVVRIVRPNEVGERVEFEYNEEGWSLPTRQYDFGENFAVFVKYKEDEEREEKSEPDGEEPKGGQLTVYLQYYDPKFSTYSKLEGFEPIELYNPAQDFDIKYDFVAIPYESGLKGSKFLERFKDGQALPKIHIDYLVGRKGQDEKAQPFEVRYRHGDNEITLRKEKPEDTIYKLRRIRMWAGHDLAGETDVKESTSTTSSSSYTIYGH